ncbi:adenylate/guanylate cyclase domain-containing protein [Bradyrhizobium sp. WSM1743]|uniref:adenylate/guanylate cyclase domain-containing protein n=1 Tax=Bradyrhizobium sp. WSM1743 TaxID=318996 RepID=UPI00041D375A|nr:adenylate/guanylate cyclase domain-containing protein [Bradyrhizobium sp. WSM1743]
MVPTIHYAKSGDVHIAYGVVGEGPVDLVLIHGWISHLEYQWEDPALARFLNRLASFSRLIVFDKRGTGLSDRVAESALPTLEQRMDDIRAVMDAAGSNRAAMFGLSEGGPLSTLFAATYPARTTALIMYGAYAKGSRADDYPWGLTREQHEAAFEAYEKHWGTPIGLKTLAPSVANDARVRQWWAHHMRVSASPGAGVTLYRMNVEVDIRAILPTIRVPTLILHRSGDRLMPCQGGRYMAEQIPAAKFVELPGDDHVAWIGNIDPLLAEIQEFLTGERPVLEADRVLATVLFIDIVQSTQRATAIGDSRWRDLVENYQQQVDKEVARLGGRVVNTAGDGVFAIFDGPARAIKCARAVRDLVGTLGVAIRCGIHTGECVIEGNDVAGIAVHIGARVAARANPGEILLSSTVKDLIAGSRVECLDRGSHVLKGVAGRWRLFAVKE